MKFLHGEICRFGHCEVDYFLGEVIIRDDPAMRAGDLQNRVILNVFRLYSETLPAKRAFHRDIAIVICWYLQLEAHFVQLANSFMTRDSLLLYDDLPFPCFFRAFSYQDLFPA